MFSPVQVLGLIAITGSFVLMLAAMAVSIGANTYRARARRLDAVMRDVLVESLMPDEIETRRIRMELLNEYERSVAAPYLDGGF